jgi:hypothetical protein
MTKTVDVAEIIDSQKVSLLPVRHRLHGLADLFLDGVDNQSIAYVGPALTNDWHLARGALRTVFSSGVLGWPSGADHRAAGRPLRAQAGDGSDRAVCGGVFAHRDAGAGDFARC